MFKVVQTSGFIQSLKIIESHKKQKQKKSLLDYINYLPVYGCVSTGLIYVGIGVTAILSFLRLKDGGADESSLLAFLHEYDAGKLFFWAILLGTVSYVVWRIYESIRDPYGYGRDAMGLAKRTGIFMSTVPDILIVLSGIQVIMHTGNIQMDGRPVELRATAESLFEASWGMAAVISVGIVLLLTALVQFFYGMTRGYRERLDIGHFSNRLKRTTHLLAAAGYLSRGIIVGIIGASFVKAGITATSEHIVNTDKAFDFIGDNIGHTYFIVVALATICYGVFMFIQGFTYDPNKD